MNIFTWLRSLFKHSIIDEKEQTPKKYSRLSQEEIDMIKSLYEFDYTIQDIVVISGRSESSVRRYLGRLDITEKE